MEKTSRDTSKLAVCFAGVSESKLTAFNLRDSVGVFGDCTTRTGCVVVVSSKFGKLRSFFCGGVPPSNDGNIIASAIVAYSTNNGYHDNGLPVTTITLVFFPATV